MCMLLVSYDKCKLSLRRSPVVRRPSERRRISFAVTCVVVSGAARPLSQDALLDACVHNSSPPLRLKQSVPIASEVPWSAAQKKLYEEA